MIYKTMRNLLIIVAIGGLVFSCRNFNYPNEDELDLIEWNVASVSSGGSGLFISVRYTDPTNLEKDPSDEYFYDFDMTQPVKLSDLVLVDGKPINQTYQIDEEYMRSSGGGRISLNTSTPLDSASVPSISFDTSTIFYWKSDEISEVMGSNIDSYIWAKVRFATELIEITY